MSLCWSGQSVKGSDTNWTIWGSNPVGHDILRNRPDRPRDPTIPMRILPIGSRSERSITHASPSSAEVKERLEFYFYCSSVPFWHVIERIFFNIFKVKGTRNQGSHFEQTMYVYIRYELLR